MTKLLKQLLAAPFVVIAAIIVLFEEWLWDDLQRLAAAIGHLPLLRRIESLIAGLPPYVALTLFAAPSLLLIPLKLAALYLIAHGQPVLGCLTVVAAKIVGTALVARIFVLTQPNLLRIAWFAWLYARFLTFKTRIHEAIRSTAVYQAVHRLRVRMRAALAEFSRTRRTIWSSRWRAAIRLSRKWRQSKEGN
ncbi:MAG TPA: hypothetical protein VJ302_10710 [Blastocatellia bacterium]|nr:hypothetical protein [Blastocatellia bacterium]